VRDWAPEYRQAAWREGLHRLGIDDDPTLALHMSTTFIEAQRSGHRPIRGAAPLVRALARQSRLGLLTNGPSDIQRHKLARSRLADCFDTVVISGELGIGKPDVRAFSHVMERLATRAEDTLMIGDSWGRDVCGALEAGMTAIWIAGGKTPPEEGREVIVVDRIDQLPENLERLRRSR
jgi:putative hydrolase of the HAD superfamily